jgi:UDP-N-acetylmuramoyl-tripeptide--D-alanyl-D-alanine ligase
MCELPSIARIVEGRLIAPAGAGAPRAAGVSIDTRSICAGDLFFAVRGGRFDGHDFIGEAARRGAAGAVVSRPPGEENVPLALIVVKDTVGALQALAAHHRRSFPLVRVVAVTGSCGKTTTKEMIGRIAAACGGVVVTKENENNHLGLPLTLLRLTAGARFVVAELGCNHLGEIGLLTRIADPDVGLVTCVAPAHTQFLGDVGGVARAKSELFAAMRPDSTAVVNLDDPRIVGMPLRSLRRVTYAAGPEAGTRADVGLLEAAVEGGGSGQRLRLRIGGEEIAVGISLPGRHNALNAAAAAAAAHAAGIGIGSIAEGLGRAAAMKGRGVLHRGRRFTLIDDSYNASPAAVAAALRGLSDLAGGRRRVAVLGDMLELGEGSPLYHRRAGEEAAATADVLIAVGEFGEELAGGARAAGMDSSRVVCFPEAKDALEALAAGGILEDGDIVLVKGSRAVKMEIIVEGIVGME